MSRASHLAQQLLVIITQIMFSIIINQIEGWVSSLCCGYSNPGNPNQTTQHQASYYAKFTLVMFSNNDTCLKPLTNEKSSSMTSFVCSTFFGKYVLEHAVLNVCSDVTKWPGVRSLFSMLTSPSKLGKSNQSIRFSRKLQDAVN